MRSTVGLTIIALLIPLAGQAQLARRSVSIQELVELSRLERERQENGPAPVEGRVYTSDDLRRFVPSGPDGEPVDEETLSALGELGDAFTRFGTDLAGPTADLLSAGEDFSGGMVGMLEAFEAGAQSRILTLQAQLSDPTLGAEERAEIQADITEAQSTLGEIRAELQSARQEQSDLGATRAEFDAVGQEFGLAPDGPAPVGSEEAWLEWQAQVDALEDRIQQLEDREVEMQLAMTDIRSAITGPTGTTQARNQARQQLASAETDLTRVREELAQVQAELEQIQAEEPGL